ncbi:MAG: YjjG family noncanonical pyrimidine nucleotidase [Eubacterium sp.]|nr:YjjG family noncanonical pyrimidine nucleotidase [Eubacterium sp.]
MIKTVLFDLDDTIFDFKMSERTALTKTLLKLGIEPNDYIISRYSEYNISQWKRLELGEISRDEVKVNRYRLLFKEFGIDSSPELATSIYEEYLAVGHYFIDGAVDMLESIYKTYDLYLVSNGAKKVQDGRLASADISHFFKDIFISEVVGHEKPNPKFFKYCFDRIPNLNKNNTIIIGDSLSSDIKGGINAGIKTMWFNPHFDENTSNIIPDYEIHGLNEVKELLKEI